MLKRTLGVVVVLAAVVGGIVGFNPALRAKLTMQYNQATGWDEAARLANPVGFVRHAEKQLQNDLETMQKTRRELAAEAGTLANRTREQAALAEQANTLAVEFRDAYQVALAADSFPIEVRGQAYTETQVHTQVSLLLAQAEGYEQSEADIKAVVTEAEQKMEELAVRIDATESQLATIPTKCELLKVRALTTEDEELLAQVDSLMSGNTQAIAGTPVRTLQELAAAEVKPTGRVNGEKVDIFLVANMQVEEPVTEAVEAVEAETEEVTETVEKAELIEVDTAKDAELIPVSYREEQEKPASKQKEKREPKRQGKPIFEQS